MLKDNCYCGFKMKVDYDEGNMFYKKSFKGEKNFKVELFQKVKKFLIIIKMD